VELLRNRQDLAALAQVRKRGPLVLVPTMGALHAGHLSLVEIAGRLGPVVVSIFVNPAQFGPQEDFAAYPQDLAADLQALAPLAVAAVFAPAVDEVYRAGRGVTVQPGARAGPLCGASRPTHFAGVLTIVAKLFHLIQPELAVFGCKDAQQLLVIDQMVRDLDFPVRLIEGATVREPDGLAMSSRNRYLSAEQRRRAGCLYASLAAAQRLLQSGERSAEAAAEALRSGMAPADRIEYAEVRSVPDLEPVENIEGRVLLAVAAQVGPARLIDNLVLQVRGCRVSPASLLGSEG
jgi:pantoate--beta-alanine ligase